MNLTITNVVPITNKSFSTFTNNFQSVNFDGHNKNKDRYTPKINPKYNNIFPQRLKSTPDENLKSVLQQDHTIYDVEKSFNRLSNFSKYLKETMVGFYLPLEYNEQGRRKFKDTQWFEEACTFFIKAAANKYVNETQYFKYAKDFWTLLSKTDTYWTSNEFIDYLNTINTNKGVTETIRAIKAIKAEKPNKPFDITFGYDDYLKKIPELIKNGCAYSGNKFSFNRGKSQFNLPPDYPTIEHVFPHNKGGKCERSNIANRLTNYILVTSENNESRWNLPLLDFLKGKDVSCYQSKMLPDTRNKLQNALEMYATGKNMNEINCSLDDDSLLYFHDFINVIDKLENNEDVSQIRQNMGVIYSYADLNLPDNDFLLSPITNITNNKLSKETFQKAIELFNQNIMTPSIEKKFKNGLKRVIDGENFNIVRQELPSSAQLSLDTFMDFVNEYKTGKPKSVMLFKIKSWYLNDCFKMYLDINHEPKNR